MKKIKKKKSSKRGKKTKVKSLHCSSKINKRYNKLDKIVEYGNTIYKLSDLLEKMWKLIKPLFYWLFEQYFF